MTACLTYLSDVLVPVAKTKQQMREEVYDVGFEQTTQHSAEHLKRQQGSLPMSGKIVSQHYVIDCDATTKWVQVLVRM